MRSKTRTSKLLALTPLLMLSAAAPYSQADILFVSDSGSDTIDCAAAPCRTIAHAIEQAQAQDQLLISQGEYRLSDGLILNKPLSLIGVGQGQVIISGQSIDSSVITVSPDTTVSISGLSIIRGSGNIRDLKRVGGGIDNQGNLTLTHVLIGNNTVEGDSGSLLLGGVYSPLGGGIYSGPGSTLNLDYCTIDNNIVTSLSPAVGTGGGGGALGGGIAAEGSTVTINHSTLSNNQAIAEQSSGGGGGAVGGAIYIADLESTGTLSLNTSTLFNNQTIGGSISLIRPILGSGGASAGGDCGSNCTLNGNIISGGDGADGAALGGGGGGAGAEISDPITGIFNNRGGRGGDGAFLGGGGGGGARSSNDNGTTGTGGDGGFGGGGAASGWALPSALEAGQIAASVFSSPTDILDPAFLDSLQGIEKPRVGTQGRAGYGAGDAFAINDFFSGSGAGAGIGAAIFADDQTEITLAHSTISQNSAVGGQGNIDGQGQGQGIGGALFNNGAATFSLQNIALIDNQSDTQNNCAVADGSGLSVTDGFYSAGADSIADSLDCDAFNLTSRAILLPSLSDNGGPTLTLRPPTAQAFDNLSTTECASTDQRQIERPISCDSGAVELASNDTANIAPSVALNVLLLDYETDSEANLFPSASVNDLDSEDFDTLTVSITDGFNAAQDLLSLNIDGNPQWQRIDALSSSWLLHNGVVVAEIINEQAEEIQLKFNRLDTSALVSSLLATITYQNSANPPSSGLRNVHVLLNDAQQNTARANMSIATTTMPTPVVLDIFTEVQSGASVNVSISEFIVLPDGESLDSIELLSSPLLGASQITADANAATITYTSDPGSSGLEQINYTINDTSNQATLFVTVMSIVPQAEEDDYLLELSAGLPDIELDVLSNDNLRGAELDQISIIIVSPPQGGELNLTDAEGRITYKVNDQSRIGEDSFSYQISNSSGPVSNVATVTLSLSAPDISTAADSASAQASSTVNIPILDNDSPGIADWDLNSLTVINGPSNGSVTLNGDNLSINYSSDRTFIGDDQFQYQITNTLGQTSAVTTVSIEVVENPNIIDIPDTETPVPPPPSSSSSSGGGGSLSFGLVFLFFALGLKIKKTHVNPRYASSH